MRLIKSVKMAGALALLVLAGAASSNAPPVAAPAVPPAAALPQREMTKADVDTWLDGYMPYALERGNAAGAVVIVVKDGKLLTQRGFGYADVAKRRPVDPETTLFKQASVSKTITWTAVMQMVEAGKIDLDKDINAYLDFKIPPYDGKPVTMRNLMTHTAGFDEVQRGLNSYDLKDIPTLAVAMKRQVPARIYAPGSTPAYSNYGAALAGYIAFSIAVRSASASLLPCSDSDFSVSCSSASAEFFASTTSLRFLSSAACASASLTMRSMSASERPPDA